jgi:hypothetical protein
MISATQRESLALLAELCELSPDIRLGQLLAHLGFLGEDATGRNLANIDDEQFLAVLYQHRSELIVRASNTINMPLSSSSTVESAGIASSAPSVR